MKCFDLQRFSAVQNSFFKPDCCTIVTYTLFYSIVPTLITPAPVCENMIQTLVHTCRVLGCCIFIEINVNRQSNPLTLKEFNIQHCSAHIQPRTSVLKYHFKKYVPFRHNSRRKLCVNTALSANFT